MPRRIAKILLLALFAVATVATAASAETLPRVDPTKAGFSVERLERLSNAMQAEVDRGRIPGAVVMILRRGEVAYEATFGMRDKAAGVPMTDDSIFRIYSMTKPITSVAAMMLWEEGKFFLNDPASKFLPALKDMRVAAETTNPATGRPVMRTVSTNGPITIQDLLRHTSGLTYGVFGKSAVKSAYLEAGVNKTDITMAEMTERLGKIPLVAEPGTFWEYSRSTDVLGHLVEVASGMTLAEFFEQRIFAPLGMADSGFSVPTEDHDRIAQVYNPPDAERKTTLLEVTQPPTLLAGGQGAVSTIEDYARFCQMLLNGGSLDGVRILSRKTVELMTANHLGPDVSRDGWLYLPGPGYGFGLGFGVREAAGVSERPGSKGDYFWGGFAGTYFWIDPAEELIGIYMMQDPANRSYMRKLFRSLVYQAIDD